MTSWPGRIAAALCLTLAWPRAGHAHEGPPFPILVDERVGRYLVSVWADPDIGVGTFYVVLEAPAVEPFPDPARVRVGVRPVSGRLPEALYLAERQEVRRGGRFFAQVEFDRGEFWDVRIAIESATGGGELATRVEATPEGTLGPGALLIYAFPFALIAALWWRAAVVRGRAAPRAGG